MKKSTLCFCIKNDKVLLAYKKEGFGSGKINAPGGKVKPNETPRQAATRELNEEVCLTAHEKDLEQVALVRFYFDKKPVFECYIYTTRFWQGEPAETDEMRPQWYPLANIPYDKMWAADSQWIPLILGGQKIEAEINFNDDGTVVKEFSYKPAHFDA